MVLVRNLSIELDGKLKARGIKNSDQLLESVKTPVARRELAKELGIAPGEVLEMANRADLARIKGIGEVFADLLENAGVDTVKELSKRLPENLHAKLAEINAQKKVSQRTPTLDMVKDWVTQAKELPKILEY